MPMLKKHPLCRPPSGAIDVRKLFPNGRWKADDGKPGLAFFGISKEDAEWPEDERQASAWVAHCDCKIHAECPASKALDKACLIYDGASLVRRRKVAP
jgi:hypothetical protein